MTHDLTKRWARNMRAARKCAGLSQTAVAEGLTNSGHPLDQTTWSRYELGLSRPAEEMQIAIARFFGVEPRDMFDLVEPNHPDAGKFARSVRDAGDVSVLRKAFDVLERGGASPTARERVGSSAVLGAAQERVG